MVSTTDALELLARARDSLNRSATMNRCNCGMGWVCSSCKAGELATEIDEYLSEIGYEED